MRQSCEDRNGGEDRSDGDRDTSATGDQLPTSDAACGAGRHPPWAWVASSTTEYLAKLGLEFAHGPSLIASRRLARARVTSASAARLEQ
jgi:hypothetical protein